MVRIYQELLCWNQHPNLIGKKILFPFMNRDAIHRKNWAFQPILAKNSVNRSVNLKNCEKNNDTVWTDIGDLVLSKKYNKLKKKKKKVLCNF